MGRTTVDLLKLLGLLVFIAFMAWTTWPVSAWFWRCIANRVC